MGKKKKQNEAIQCLYLQTAQQAFVGLEDILKTCLEDVLKTYLEGVLKTCLEDVLKTCLEDIMETNKIVTGDICI